MLSLSVPAFAEVYVDGEFQGTGEVPAVDSAQWVEANAGGDKLTVTGDVTGESLLFIVGSVSALDGAEIKVGGDVTSSGHGVAIHAISGATVEIDGAVTGSGDWGAIWAKGDNTTVTVQGDVTESGNGEAIRALYGATVEIDKDVNESGDGNAIFAIDSDTTVTVHGNVTESGSGDAIYATDSDTTVKDGSVDEKDDGHAINASYGATVEIDGNVTESGIGDAIYATDGVEVTVKGNVTVSVDRVYGDDNTTVTVHGNVTEAENGNAIWAEYGATVEIDGNVTESGLGDAIYATDGAKVTVEGNVTESGYGRVIYAEGDNTTVTVQGDVTESDGGFAFVLSSGATVIVEGIVKADGLIGVGDDSALYLGQLDAEYLGNAHNRFHYLIGIAPEGSAALSAVTLVSDIVAEGKIDGVNEQGYRYTTTADTTALYGKTITLKPADGKKLTVSGFDGADVTYVANEDGTFTFTIGDSFTGGLQNLMLVLTNKPGPTPGPDPDPTPGPAPVYYIVPVGSVYVVKITVPEGVEEGLITKLYSADHAGLTVDSSLVGDGSVKVLKDGEELSAKDFSIYTHADGSIDVILSNTYLFALGSGSYDFTAIVNGLVIPFTVVVEIY